MKNFKITRQGFTLIELLMVVAILAALAAVSMPVYGQYQIRVYNSTAISDLKNFRILMEAEFSDQQRYPVF